MSAIATLEEVKLYIDDQGIVDVKHDPFLQMLLDAAEDSVARYTRRRLWPEPALVDGVDSAAPVPYTVHVGRPNGGLRSVVKVPDLREVTSISLGGGPLSATNNFYLMGRERPVTRLKLLPSISFAAGGLGAGYRTWDELVITGRWGFNPPPPAAKDAVLTLVARGFAERRASYGDTVENSDGAAVSYFRELPGRVKWMLRPLRKPLVGVL